MRRLYARIKKGIFAISLVGLVSLLFFAIRTFFSDSLAYLAWLLKLIYLFIPEGLIWGAFLVGIAMLALFSLQRTSRVLPRERFAPPQFADRRVKQVANWFGQPNSAYYQGRINFALTKIATGTFALHGRASEQEIKHELRRGQLDLPADVEAYLQNGLKRWPELAEGEAGSLADFIRRSLPSVEFSDGNKRQRRKNFERVIQFLEEELEIKHGD